jgi:phasin family protein
MGCAGELDDATRQMVASTIGKSLGGSMAKNETGDFRKAAGIDFEAIATSQRKNFEALMQANELAVNGAQAVVRRQIEIGRQMADGFSTMLGDLVKPNGSVEDRFAKHAEYSKKAIEKGLSSVREIGELVTKANNEALGVISKRVVDGFDEMRGYTRKV